jgi:hypothetical protein
LLIFFYFIVSDLTVALLLFTPVLGAWTLSFQSQTIHSDSR